MTYTAKYLPVEGEMQVGDTASLKEDHPAGRIRKLYSERMQTYWDGNSWENTCRTFAIDPTPQDGAGYIHIHEIFKVKLFLISDDIQVGDIIIPKDKYFECPCKVTEVNLTKDTWGAWGKPHLMMIDPDGQGGLIDVPDDMKDWLKVIGEIINPEGIVEGQTFTEDDWELYNPSLNHETDDRDQEFVKIK